jgi:hypothetical protein
VAGHRPQWRCTTHRAVGVDAVSEDFFLFNISKEKSKEERQQTAQAIRVKRKQYFTEKQIEQEKEMKLKKEISPSKNR